MLGAAANFRKGGKQQRILQSARRARLQSRRPQRTGHRVQPQTADKTLADIRLINDSKKRARRIAQGNQNAPGWRSAHERAGAIDRIKHPR